MALMEVVLQQNYFNQITINRWNYIASGTPSAVSYSFALASAFGGIENGGVYPPGTIITALAALQSDSVLYAQIGAKDVYDAVDFFENPFIPALSGDLGDESLSPVNSFGFRTNRTRTDIRRATKRFVGVTVNSNDDGGQIAPTILSGPMTTLANLMSQTLQYDDNGNILEFQPCVVSREKYTPDPLKPDNVAYKYYDTEAEQLQHVMTSIVWEPYTTVRTQNSRQYGRGQ